MSVRNGQSTVVGGPQAKIDQNGSCWSLANAKIRFGIRSFRPKWSFGPFWAMGQYTFRQYRGHSLVWVGVVLR